LALSGKEYAGRGAAEIFAGLSGVYGDRLFAFKSSAAPSGFPYLTGREQHNMLLYRPRFRHLERAAKPPNLAEAEALSPLLNPVTADPADLALDVETPTGELLAINDPALPRQLAEGAGNDHSLTLLRSERSMTDCRPISLFSLQTARQWVYVAEKASANLVVPTHRTPIPHQGDHSAQIQQPFFNSLLGRPRKAEKFGLDRRPRCDLWPSSSSLYSEYGP